MANFSFLFFMWLKFKNYNTSSHEISNKQTNWCLKRSAHCWSNRLCYWFHWYDVLWVIAIESILAKVASSFFYTQTFVFDIPYIIFSTRETTFSNQTLKFVVFCLLPQAYFLWLNDNKNVSQCALYLHCKDSFPVCLLKRIDVFSEISQILLVISR